MEHSIFWALDFRQQMRHPIDWNEFCPLLANGYPPAAVLVVWGRSTAWVLKGARFCPNIRGIRSVWPVAPLFHEHDGPCYYFLGLWAKCPAGRARPIVWEILPVCAVSLLYVTKLPLLGIVYVWLSSLPSSPSVSSINFEYQESSIKHQVLSIKYQDQDQGHCWSGSRSWFSLSVWVSIHGNG